MDLQEKNPKQKEIEEINKDIGQIGDDPDSKPGEIAWREDTNSPSFSKGSNKKNQGQNTGGPDPRELSGKRFLVGVVDWKIPKRVPRGCGRVG